ncbi:hypothetical protein GC163_00785 [bacterium]|nr:hypothetical protein [bacterium]
MQRVKLSLLCLLSLCGVYGTASAQVNQIAPDSEIGIATLQDYSGGVSYGGAYFDVRTMTGDGVGYRQGYTQLGASLPIWVTDDMFIAPNARLILTDNSQVGLNLYSLVRKYDADRDRVFGGYMGYDFDHSVEGFDYNQFGFGFDTLGERWDARVNAYFPTTDDVNFVRELNVTNTALFQGNQLGFLANALYQRALNGVDFEYGMPLTKSTPWLRGYAGAYFYDGYQEDPIGFRGRIDAWISDDLLIGMNVTTDQVNSTNVNFVADFRFSGWKPTRYFPNWTTRERMTQSVQRNWRVNTANTVEQSFLAAKNPDTGKPYFVVWVDNSNNKPGDGSFENPFNYLPNSAPGADLILVRKGDTNVLNPLSGSITLEDNQRFLGEGKVHQADVLVMFESIMFQTTIDLPGFTDDGTFPYLTSPGDIVTIADNNEVSGFNFINAGGYAVTNIPAQGSHNFNLNCLNITGNGGGIFISNATGTGIIHDVNAFNNLAGGISVESGNSPLGLAIYDVVSSSSPPGTQAYGLQLIADTGRITADISDIQLNRNTDGLVLIGNNGDFNINLTGASIDDSTNNGIRLTTTGSDVAFAISNTTVNGSAAEGFIGSMTGGSLALQGRNVTVNNSFLDNLNLSLTNTDMAIDFQNATFNNSVQGSGFVLSNSGGSGGGTLLLDNVTATGNFLDGLSVTGNNFTDIDGLVRGSVFSNNGRDAIAVSATNSATVDLEIRAVAAQNSGRHGLNFNATSDADLSIVARNTNFSFSGSNPVLAGNGINGFANDANVDVTLVNVNASSAGNNGMFVNAINNANVTLSVDRSNLQNSGQNTPGGDGVHIITDTGATVAMQINATPINNTVPFPAGTQDDGLVLEAMGASTIVANLSNLSLSDNLSNAIEVTASDSSQVGLSIENVDGDRSGEDGILFNVQTGALFVFDSQSASFDDSGASGMGDGIDGFIRSDGDVSFNWVATTVRRSAENGFLLDIADPGSTFTANIETGDFSNSGRSALGVGQQDAFHITAANEATVDITLLNTPSQNSALPPLGTQQRGLFATVNTGAQLSFDNQGGDMSNNLLNAINISVANPGSFASLNIDSTPANNSGEDGFIFNVSDSGVLTASFTNSTLDNSGSIGGFGDDFDAIDGLIDSDGVVQLNFVNTALTNANSDGMQIVASTGGILLSSFNNSPFDNAGTNNSGDAIRLTFSSGALGVVTLLNGSTATNAGDDAVFVSATGNGTQVAVNAFNSDFSDSGTTATVDGGNGIRALVSNDAAVLLNINDTDITNTVPTTPQQRGLLFDVASGGLLVGSFTNSTMSDHDLSGIQGTVTGLGLNDSTAILILEDSPVNNNNLFGAIFDVSGGGDLLLDVSGTDPATNSFSNNGANGIFANVDGVSSSLSLLMDGTAVDGNGAIFGGDGITINADNGAFITGYMNEVSISNNGGSGLAMVLDNGSVGDFGLGTITNPANTNSQTAGITDTVIDGNSLEGLFVLVDNGSTLDFNMTGTAAGLSSISNNGISGVAGDAFNSFDNVNIEAANGSDVEVQFVQTSADGATRSGFNFTATDSIFLAQLRAGTTADGNTGGNGVRFVGSGATTQAVLFMDESSADATITGTNSFSNNGTAVITANGGPDVDVPLTGAGVFFQATNVDVAGVRLSGSADNNGNMSDPIANRDIDGDGDGDHDGFYVNFNGANTAGFELVGSSSANGNVDDGLDLNITGVTALSQIIQPSDLTPPSVTIGGPDSGITITDFSVDGNGGDGIQVIVTGPTTLGDIIVNNVTSTNNGGNGLLISLTDVTFNSEISVTESAFSGNGLNGVALVMDTVGGNLSDVTFDEVLASTNGQDGLLLDFTDVSTLPNLTITNGQYSDNTGNGVNIDLTNSALGTVLIEGNNASGGAPTGIGALVLIGSSANLEGIQNTSTGTIQITDFVLDMTAPDFYFDTVEPGAAFEFDPDAFSSPFGLGLQGDTATVGLVSIDGQTINPGVVPLEDTNGNPLPGGGVTDDSHVLTMSFNDFDPGEIYDWTVDTDEVSQTAGGPSGIDFVIQPLGDATWTGPATATVTFSTGDVVTGAFVADPNNAFGAMFVVTPPAVGSGAISGNGLDGIRISQVNSDFNSLTINDNEISNNGQSGTGSGVNFAVQTNSDTGPIVITNNTISGNATDGVTMTNLNPTSGAVDLTVDSNVAIDNNGGRGINIVLPDNIDLNLVLTNNTSISGNGSEGVLVDMGQNSTLTMTQLYGNTINSNGLYGLHVELPDNSTASINVGDSAQTANTFDGNSGAGLYVNMTGANPTATLNIQNSTFSNSNQISPLTPIDGDGVHITLNDTASMSLTVGTATTPVNTFFTGNDDDGISIDVLDNAQLINAVVQNVSATGNGTAVTPLSGAGLRVLREGQGVIDNFTITDSTFNNNEYGLDIDARFAQLDDEYLITNNTFNNNQQNGASITARADARVGIMLENNTFNNNGADGMNILTIAVSAGDAAEVFSLSPWDNNDFNGNGTTAGAAGAGLELSGNGIFTLDIGVLNPDPQVFSNRFNNNFGDGIEINGPGTLNLVDAQITGNNRAGSANGLAGIDINSVGGNNITVSNSDISLNLGDGVEIDNTVNSGSSFTFTDNLITFNGRDGVEFVDVGSGNLTINGTGVGTSIIMGNGTSGTGGRGVDIIAGGSTVTNSSVVIDNVMILSNAQEGVNVILTADAAQGNAANRDALSSAALASNGGITSTPFLDFTLTNSVIDNNGQTTGNIGGAGLVMRVGTTRGGDGPTAAGGFAGTANGGIIANVTGNQLSGNFGADVLFESFVSISNSGNSGTAWTDQNEAVRNGANDVYNPAGYQSDPLARLDLTFSNNTGEELDVTRLGAFYNNADNIFKSRLDTAFGGPDTNVDGGADDNGPFGLANRHRNAQRLAARNVDILGNAGGKLQPDLTIGASDSFLFSGLGASTFRVNDQTTANNVFNIPNFGFLMDNLAGDPFGNPAIYDSVLDAGGVFNAASPFNTFTFDVMPFGWGLLP